MNIYIYSPIGCKEDTETNEDKEKSIISLLSQ